MKLPSKRQMFGLYKKYAVPTNIALHCKAVSRVSVFLAKALKKKGVKLNIHQVEALALVHDMFKAATIDTLKKNAFYKAKAPTKKELLIQKTLKKKYAGLHESDIAFDIFKKDYPEFAKSIVRESTFHDKLELRQEKKSIEEKLVSYSDYIVLVHDVVTLKERYDYLEGRYKDLNSKNHAWQKEKEAKIIVEKEIFSQLDFSPQKLKEMMN